MEEMSRRGVLRFDCYVVDVRSNVSDGDDSGLYCCEVLVPVNSVILLVTFSCQSVARLRVTAFYWLSARLVLKTAPRTPPDILPPPDCPGIMASLMEKKKS